MIPAPTTPNFSPHHVCCIQPHATTLTRWAQLQQSTPARNFKNNKNQHCRQPTHLPCSINDWNGITFIVAIVVEPISNRTAIRMFFDDSFNKLLTFLQMDLQVNVEMVGLSNGGAILPEIRVYICHQYSAGGGLPTLNSSLPGFLFLQSCIEGNQGNQ